MVTGWSEAGGDGRVARRDFTEDGVRLIPHGKFRLGGPELDGVWCETYVREDDLQFAREQLAQVDR